MQIRDLDDQFARGAKLIQKLTEERLGLLRNAHQSGLARAQLEDWEDLGKAERSVQQEYAERYLFELLQNANDAIKDWIDLHPGEEMKADHRVRLILTWNSLLIANTGEPFRENNVRSICRLGKTTKSASKHVGHKGIGFKSVLGITEAPEIYSDCYAFGFSRPDCENAIQKIVGREWSVDFPLPIHRFPFQRQLRRVPSDERAVIEALFADDYVTVIRLPLSVPWETVAERMRHDLTPKVLLFLNAIGQLEMVYPSGEDTAYWRQIHQETNRAGDSESYQVSLWSDASGEAEIDSRWLVLEPDQVEIEDRGLISQFGESWQEVERVGFSIAFPLDLAGQTIRASGQSYHFYVYFPTDEDSGLQFLVNADYYTGTSRKYVPNEPFNHWLSEQLAFYLADKGVHELTRWFPDNPAVVDILAPVRDTHGEFDEHFRCKCSEWLKTACFVPLGKKRYAMPERVRLIPKGADAASFRQFFKDLSSGADWSFPMLAVEEAEKARGKQGRPFLLDVGATYLSTQEALDTLKDGPSVSIDECGPFFDFLVKWWQSLLYSERNSFVTQLRDCRIVPTTRRWKRPNESLIFQGLGDEDVVVPEGFDFDVVSTGVYGETGQSSPPYLLLKELGVADYRSREIIRQAIMPAFESPERFARLSIESITQAYRFLKNYLETRRGGDEVIDNRVSAVLLPAFRLADPAKREWRRADEIYFAQYWTSTDDLEVIYGEFEDVFFLGQPDFLHDLDEVAKEEWYRFFEWLGVSYAPRLLKAQYLPTRPAAPYEFRDILTQHPHATGMYWRAYLERYEGQFVCDNPKHPHTTYRLLESYILHKFEDLVARGTPVPLMRFFKLLGHFWSERYRPYRQVDIRCNRTSCAQGRQIPAYFYFALREAPWVPAMIPLEEGSYQPLPPREVWTLGEAEPPTVQRMVPVLPQQFRSDDFATLCNDVGMMSSARASFNDYLALLQRLPELYPLDRSDLDDSILITWQRSVRAVFNWLCERMYTIISGHSGTVPNRPETLKVLAFRGDEMCYAEVGDVVYPDDPYLEAQWADACLYLKIDEDYGPLRDWLRMDALSTRVDSEPAPSPDLLQDTARLQARYQAMLPYFLALVEHKQPSKFERLVLPRLRRLEIHVVEELIIRQMLSGDDNRSKEVIEDVYLATEDIALPTGGSARAGHLFIRQSALPNWDLLGDPVASYIEIKTLADAFITLFNRDDDSRRRFLQAKGVPEESYARACNLLGQPLRDDRQTLAITEEEVERLKERLREDAVQKHGAGVGVDTGTKLAVPGSDDRKTQEEQDRDAAVHLGEKVPSFDFPDFDTAHLSMMTYVPGSGEAPGREQVTNGGDDAGGGGPGPIDWRTGQARREAIGRRGEAFVNLAERQRLQDLGFDPDVCLRWVSTEDETADHDFESVDELGQPIIIEVKATAGASASIRISRQEFQRAVSAGPGYWLYYVTHADTARPNLYRYPDPVKLWLDGEITLEFDRMMMNLPKAASSP